MRLQFKVQAYQSEAVAAVVDCFAGQPRRDPGNRNAPLRLDPERLLANIRAVQRRAGLPLSTAPARSDAAPDGTPNLDVEMETGTGKTYVYIKTIMELNRRYGWAKFIVVVPGVAIREGVRRSFEVTGEHFRQAYGTRPRHFVYDSAELHELERFRDGAGVQVMIINVQAFNSAARDNRRIYDELDAFRSRRPIDVISAARPVVIIDEPQRIGSARSLASLSRFDPLMVLRYSATHRVTHDLVHRLDAREAYRERLVKKITVIGLESPSSAPVAAIRRVQIREVIRAHLDKERELWARGIKVLSLLFIDRVSRYRDYSADDELGEYARIFVEEYQDLVAAEPDGDYRRHLASIPVERTHQGYFAIDRRTRRWVDPTSTDIDAYSLILRDRERLLSPEEPVRFIFSHSALREGWDNPNVFVMGMLKSSDNIVSRRQEVGRGLRLAVDRDGERMDDPAVVHEINELTVVTDESYASFVAGLQKEAGFGAVTDGRRLTRLARNANFHRPEFQAAVERISRRAVYRVDFDSTELIARCVAALDASLRVDPLRIAVQAGQQVRTYPICGETRDLIGEITETTGLTRHTVGDILAGVDPQTFGLYRNDPAHFTEATAILINREKSELVLQGLSYDILPVHREIFTDLRPRIDLTRAGPRLAKNIYDHATTDLALIHELETREDVVVYARLPGDYVIPTPLGDYHPGWLVALDNGCTVIADDKSTDPARIECAKRFFAALDVPFSVAAPRAVSRPADGRTPRSRAGTRR
ncbi:DEAD/DEAH box helicase family protein [Actinoplanes hulinensis]|uniref:DEAD/DEAH box helicase family protein n=1 Tax=Actinoplanes hulinensis TaxID=1144547 RepID=A0ABS7BBK2_9ACTN|nr:DEAD/DEAH box helicase family protein [Actinoplanes hulinensis]MBW6438267.1 DEAD/DEAH box helicase family protein [Actinoplanes hulinensis]